MQGLARREVMAVTAAGLLWPAHRLGAQPVTGFTHGVASGEPTAHSVLLWTRYAGAGDVVPLKVEIASDPQFTRVIARSSAVAQPHTDWTARITVEALPADMWLWYRWCAPDGSWSATGRTRTLPETGTNPFSIALFSCSNLGFGWFNAMAHAAAREDLDLAVHLGDYIYEYPLGNYPGAQDIVSGRDIAPDGALVHLADYRQRYASYRRCPDLQALHARLPMIAVWDDHEFADNAQREGAYNHDPATEGSWEARKEAARQAWEEWLPVSSSGRWNSLAVGDLATLLMLETRVSGRTASPDLYAVPGRGGDFADFAAQEWQDDAFRILGEDQEAWLKQALRSEAQRSVWQVVLQSVPMGHAVLPKTALSWVAAGGRAGADEVAMLVEAGQHNIPFNMDNWGGFPAQRKRILAAAQAAGANLIVTSGDSHNGWGYDLVHEGRRAGVEIAVPSVTSPGFERWFPQESPDTIARAMIDANPALFFADTRNRGYGTLKLEAERAALHWIFTGSSKIRDSKAFRNHTTWIEI